MLYVTGHCWCSCTTREPGVQEPVPAGMAIGGFDHPFDLGAIQSFHRPAALARRCQPQLTARLFHTVFSLVISQVVFAPKLGGLTGDIP